MKSSEKAKELVKKFGVSIIIDETGREWRQRNEIQVAIQYALICVEEILESSPLSPIKNGENMMYPINYWKEVKLHLNNL